ncbi:MAG: hypothetical protein M1832_005688 [Thelocarpon impressellum]|nr:MAG: hypothetical protein M1832_005688 [Thelocarpon impressellum]
MGVAAFDVENGAEKRHFIDETGAVPAETFEIGDTLYARLQRLAGRARIEQRGIERVPENERTDKSLAKVGTLWLSANMVVSTFAIGALSNSVFHLGFVDAVLTIFFINLLGITPVCFWSTFGPRFGLRQMVLSRYYFGFHGVKIIAIFNILACVGWSAVNVIKFSNIPMGFGSSEAGSVLSLSASVFGFATGWTSYAADYTVYQPVNTGRTKVFLWTFAGLAFPLLFTEMLGAAVITAIVNTPDYAVAYKDDHVGGLLAEVLVPPLGRFGEFCLVVLALSIIANNCPNIYSVSLTVQIIGRWTQNVPRFLWTFVSTLVYCAIAIPGYSHFESVLENFMLLIAYWLAIYQGISLSEHFIFKRGYLGYAVEIYDQPSKLPPGFAAIAAFCIGIFGAVMGMAQVWFVGPIGKKIGDPKSGGDVGFELAFAFSAISYIGFRWVEFRRFGR